MRDLRRNTSGDLLADRRFAIAEALGAEGDHAAAADLLEQTLERVPDWAPAWLALALAHERTGDAAAATTAFRRASDLDPDGTLGASLHLARMLGSPDTSMPPAFVEALFDQYAEHFEAHLVDTLHYTGPSLVADALARAGAKHFRAVLDLGCGTGLMARTLRDRADAIDGVDLSARMSAKARATGLYRQVTDGELVEHLRGLAAESYHGVVAADVLVYIGCLDAVVAQAFRVVTPGGAFAFTVQLSAASQDYELSPDMRFSHAKPYVERVLKQAGFASPILDEVSTRKDRGIAVPGLVVVAHRP